MFVRHAHLHDGHIDGEYVLFEEFGDLAEEHGYIVRTAISHCVADGSRNEHGIHAEVLRIFRLADVEVAVHADGDEFHVLESVSFLGQLINKEYGGLRTAVDEYALAGSYVRKGLLG